MDSATPNEQFVDEQPSYMTDCTLATECQGFGLCSLCVAFKFSIKLLDGKVIHFDSIRTFSRGDVTYHEFIGCDGRKWRVRDEQIIWYRDNDPDYEEFDKNLMRQLEEQKKKNQMEYL